MEAASIPVSLSSLGSTTRPLPLHSTTLPLPCRCSFPHPLHLHASTTLITARAAAVTVTAEEVALVLTKVQNVYLKFTGIVRSACGIFGMILDQISSFVKAAAPYIQNAFNVGTEILAPVVTFVILQVEKSLQFIGLDTEKAVQVLKAIDVVVKKAIQQTAKALEPVASSILESIQATNSAPLFRAAGVVLLLYFMAPPLFSSVASAARGYKGDFSALQAFDMIIKRDYLLVDVRTEKEKRNSGIPGLPRYAVNKLLFVPVEELSLKFKGQLRDYRKAEAEVAAIKISYLKRINKSSKVLILDRYGDMAKSVARSLTKLGIKNTWVVIDGFDGGRGWIQSRMGTTSYSTSIAQILLPSRIISEGAKKIFPSSKDVDISPQSSKLLPGGFD